MTLTPEQKAEGWIEWNGGERPIKDSRTRAIVMLADGDTFGVGSGSSVDWSKRSYLTLHKRDIIAYRIIEAHGADAEPARPTPMFDLQRSHDHSGEAHWKAGRVFYNVIDMPGLFRGQIALTDDERHAIGGTIFAVSTQAARPTPFPADYSELVWDADGWSQTIIVDGKRPEWLRDDDRCIGHVSLRAFGWTADHMAGDELAIRVRRREPKRETTGCVVYVPATHTNIAATIDLIDGKPDLSTLKIAEDAL